MSSFPPFSRIIYSWARGDARGFRRYECQGELDGRWEALTFNAPGSRGAQRSHWTFQLDPAESQGLFRQASTLVAEFLGTSASHRWLEQAGRENEGLWLFHDQGVFGVPGSRPEARRFLAFLEQWPWTQDGPHQFFARLRAELEIAAAVAPRPIERARSAPTQRVEEDSEEREPSRLVSPPPGQEAEPKAEAPSPTVSADNGQATATSQRWIERSGYIRRGTKSWQTAIRGSGLFEGAVIEAETVVHESQERLDPEQLREIFSKLDDLYRALERYDAGDPGAPSGQVQAQWYAFHGFWESPRYFAQSSPEFKQIAALLSPLTISNPAVQAFFTKI